jgi:hypothetical protein
MNSLGYDSTKGRSPESDSTKGQDKSPGPDKKHPFLFYWLTGGAATIIAAVIGVSVATSPSHSSTSSQSVGSQSVASQSGGSQSIGSQGSGSSGVPAAYQGSWAGPVTYPTIGATSEITLTLNAGQVGDEVGQWANVNLNCGGTATLESGGTTLSLHLVTTDNASGVCVSQADAQVSQAGSDIAIVFESDFGAAPGSGTLSPSN